MGTPGYGDYLLLCVGSFAIGVGIGWMRRRFSRSYRIKSTAKAISIFATLPSIGILGLALLNLDAPDNPLRAIESSLVFIAGLALPFIWILGWIGIPLVFGSAVPRSAPEPSSEQGVDRKPDHVAS